MENGRQEWAAETWTDLQEAKKRFEKYGDGGGKGMEADFQELVQWQKELDAFIKGRYSGLVVKTKFLTFFNELIQKAARGSKRRRAARCRWKSGSAQSCT